MKKLKRQTAIFLIALFSLLIVLGGVLSFVPLNLGNSIWTTFSKGVNVSSDIVGGVYGEYEIKTENATKADIVDSMSLIREVFDEHGYKNVNVYALGNKKIRIEASYPQGASTFKDVYSRLSNVGSGAFYLSSTSKLEDAEYYVQGSTGVAQIKVSMSNSSKVLTVKFNETGKKAFKDLCEKSGTNVYILFGEQSYSLDL